ncbi:MAG: M1 family metallopeptidase [Acidimicrobiales bacterium]
MPATSDQYRLPRTVIPERYELTLEPDLVAATFTGFASVTVGVLEAVDEIVLNALELDIEEAWLEGRGGHRVDTTVTYEPETERARLVLAGTADPGRWTLHARFRGALNDRLTGFYRSAFTDDDGVEHVIATTQFEATHARKAFPCWDEPDLKAVFSVTLVVPEETTALSNSAQVANETATSGRRTVRFADTMKMSTYLVAFVIGPFELTDAVDVDGVPLRVAHVPGRAKLASCALEAGAFALRFFTNYYGIPYPGDKVDLVAIPDFAFGAMENVGCITFREIALLVDPERASQPELQRVADVVNHELAHMWFGDLVTMKWWNGLWLNEAFATFMEMKCTDAFRPDWQRWVDFGLSRTGAFDTDALASTRPIEFEVVSPEEAEGMFDVLTYEKGAAVLRMLEQYLGEDAMRDGIRHYLTSHSYGNTETTDLWDAIETTTGQPARRIMDSWILQGGYPVISAELVGGGSTLRLAQERFRFEGSAEASGPSGPLSGQQGVGGERWAVPLIISYGSDGASRSEKVLLDTGTTDVELGFSPQWVLANTGGSGFYRVHYEPKLLHALAARGPQLTSLERYGLVDDAFASVLAGATTAAEFVEVARGFADETDLSVWQRLAGALRALSRLVDGEALERYRAVVRGLAGPALLHMGWEPGTDEGGRTRELRATLFDLLGSTANDDHVVARATALLQRYLDDAGSVDPALARAALVVVCEHGGPEEFDLVLARQEAAATPQDERRFLFALGRFHDDELVARALVLALEHFRSQDAPFLVQILLANRTHGPVAWQFVTRHWDDLNKRFPRNMIIRMLEGVTVLTEPAVARDIEGFFAEHPVPQGQKTLEQHLERLKVNVALREREADRFPAALP